MTTRGLGTTRNRWGRWHRRSAFLRRSARSRGRPLPAASFSCSLLSGSRRRWTTVTTLRPPLSLRASWRSGWRNAPEDSQTVQVLLDLPPDAASHRTSWSFRASLLRGSETLSVTRFSVRVQVRNQQKSNPFSAGLAGSRGSAPRERVRPADRTRARSAGHRNDECICAAAAQWHSNRCP